MTIPESDTLLDKLTDIQEKCKENKDISENKLKRYFHKSGILEELGYDEEDIHVEETVKEQKRTDIHVTDDYGNVRAVIEFKKPTIRNLEDNFDQLWNRYMKPLKAKYGFLYNGFKLYFYERIRNNHDKKFGMNVLDLERQNVSTIVQKVQKPKYDLTKIEVVSEYLKGFEDPEEKLNLKDEASREHFFENFKLKKDSAFGDLLRATIDLFNEMEKKGDFGFLKSAYDFWKRSYAKKPDKVPKNWEPVMEECGMDSKQEDLYRFMFCLETTYALFTRLILAKSAEDYEFADIKFVGFIETEIERASFRGDIPRASWAKITQDLISDMRSNLVSSVFEEDIFYWWTEPYEDTEFRDFFKLSDEELTYTMDEFGEKIRKILLTFCKFDFSEIKGDPLGILYQRYFDKETRKALGEFYTPQEVVDYILDSVDYKGRKVLDKRLLDPACGSGTFLVTALKRYLEASEDVAEEKGWDWVLDNLCNNYRIVGFDIHPFATIMAQIQFMLVLLPYYKKAIEDNSLFVLRRVPIFRTDSLLDESETGEITLRDFDNGERISMKVKLPVEGEEGDFFEESFMMPYSETVLRNTDIYNNEEYFGALQGLFDVVKEQAEVMSDEDEVPEFDEKRFEKVLKRRYLSDKDWNQISSFFRTFGNELIEEIHELQTEFDDGRLIKSIEDIFLAALLKNEQKYDYVVGNPPYVRKELIDNKDQLKNTYNEIYHGDADISIYFLGRGIEWLNNDGKLGYINTGKFMKTRYGKYIRSYIPRKTSISQIIDLRSSKVFKDAANDPVIICFDESLDKKEFNYVRVVQDKQRETFSETLQNTLQYVGNHLGQNFSDEYIWSAKVKESTLLRNEITKRKSKVDNWLLLPSEYKKTFDKIDSINLRVSEEFNTYYGLKPGRVSVYRVGRDLLKKFDIEKEVYRPLVEGKEVRRWEIERKDKYLIFPYEEIEDEYQRVELDDYPNLKNYLENHRKSLANRYDIKNSSQKWYELRACDYYEELEKKKILVPDISSKNNFALDKKGIFCLDTVFSLVPNNKIDLKVSLGILNSKTIEFYFKQISSYLGSKGYRYKKQYLDKIPLVLDDEEKTIKIKKRVNKILNQKNLENKISHFPKNYFGSKEKKRKRIVSESEHTSITPYIQETHNEMFGVVIDNRKKENPILVDSEEKAEFVKKTLEDDSVKKDEEIEVLVPKSNSDVKQILEKYEEDKEKLEEMPSIEELEEDINEIVYELYGLEEKDIEVIEEFLEKF